MKIVKFTVRSLILLALYLPLSYFIVLLLYQLWSGATYKSRLNPIVLTNTVEMVMGGKTVILPEGLVLYPLNGEECCPEVNDGHEYKIYVDSSVLRFREITDEERAEEPNLIYRIDEDASDVMRPLLK